MSTGGGGPEINVTPLIDVCLVLLVIFMVITPMLQKGQAVDLPKTDRPEKKPDAENTRIVSIDKDGGLFIDRDRFVQEQFFAKLREEKERIPALEIQLKGDRRLEYGKVLDVMKGINDIDIHTVALITEKVQASAM